MSTPDLARICTFHVGDHLYGIDVRAVREVLVQSNITPVPLAPPAVVGVMNLRGRIVTAIDLRRRLDLPERPAGIQPVSVVVEADDELVSFLVDRAGDVLAVSDAAFERPPETLRGAARDLIQGAYKHSAQLVLLLDPLRAAAPGAEPEPHAEERA